MTVVLFMSRDFRNLSIEFIGSRISVNFNFFCLDRTVFWCVLLVKRSLVCAWNAYWTLIDLMTLWSLPRSMIFRWTLVFIQAKCNSFIIFTLDSLYGTYSQMSGSNSKQFGLWGEYLWRFNEVLGAVGKSWWGIIPLFHGLFESEFFTWNGYYTQRYFLFGRIRNVWFFIIIKTQAFIFMLFSVT